MTRMRPLRATALGGGGMASGSCGAAAGVGTVDLKMTRTVNTEVRLGRMGRAYSMVVEISDSPTSDHLFNMAS